MNAKQFPCLNIWQYIESIPPDELDTMPDEEFDALVAQAIRALQRANFANPPGSGSLH